LAVKPDDIRALADHRAGDGVVLGQPAFDIQEKRVIRRQFRRQIEQKPQIGAQRLLVMQRRGHAGAGDCFAIRLDPRRIDPIQRGAGHQPDRPHPLIRHQITP